MKATIQWVAVLVGLVAWNAYGAFEKPTHDQLKEAAKDPSKVVALLQDASIDQAAETAKDVIIQIVYLDLKPAERNDRIAAVVTYLFKAMPEDQWKDLAIALAKFVAASPAASMAVDNLSTIQRTIIEETSKDVGEDFGNAYNLAMLTIAGAPAGGKTVPPQPPPPPVALPLRPPVAQPYEAQRLP
jgi:hypothetical protein